MIAGYVARADMGEARWLYDGMLFRDIVFCNGKIDGCARIRNASEACSYFDSMPFWNVVSCNTLLFMYVLKVAPECLSLFDSMLREEEIKPNRTTLVECFNCMCQYRGSQYRPVSLFLREG